ncbi:hypothetical protein [Actinomadura gamaensis]|uniref:DUF8129 domain-containing protein n=1 Tax=Actinomadura gamaensis TaxID=1763541 RepID=A0ABV9U897_9ACTN
MTRSPRRLKEQVKDTVGEQVRDLPLHAVRLAMFGVGRALLLSDRVTRDYKEITEGGGVKPVLGRLRHDVQHTAVSVVGTVVERVRGGEPEPEPEARPSRSRTRATGSRPTSPRATTRPAERDKEISVGKPAASRPAPKPDAQPEPKAAAKPEPKPTPKPEPKAAAKPEPKPAPKSVAAVESAAKPELKPSAKPELKPAAADEPVAKPAPKPAPEATAKPKPAEPAKPAATSKSGAELPVPDYDTATLPQLRARLRGLTVDQVKLLREYEREHEARPDIIRMYENRIAKLNGSH